MTTNENDWFLLDTRVKITLKIIYIAKILWIGTRGSICFCNKAIANDDLLSLFTTSRNVANSADIRSEFSDCLWYQWQPMAANAVIGKKQKLQTYPYIPFKLRFHVCCFWTLINCQIKSAYCQIDELYHDFFAGQRVIVSSTNLLFP